MFVIACRRRRRRRRVIIPSNDPVRLTAIFTSLASPH